MRKHLRKMCAAKKNETHTEGTSGDGQKTETGTDDPYMNSLYGGSTYGSGSYNQKNTAYAGGTYGSQNASGQIDIENLKKENQKNKTEKTVLWVILAVLTSPVWITVAAVLAAILVAILACVFAVAVSIVAVMAALVITGFVLAGIGVGYLFTKGVAVGLGLLGGGLLVLALGILAVWLVVWCFGWFVPWAVKGIAELCKKALMCRHNRLKGTLSDAAPILWQYGALARLEKGETIDKLLYGGYSTISLDMQV